MDPAIVDLLKTIVQIGLGALIGGTFSYLTLKINQSHELEKETTNQFHKLQEEKKLKYIEFLSQSQALIQKYLFTDCMADDDEYKALLRIYNEVQIISPKEVRGAAAELLGSVGTFIMLNKDLKVAFIDKIKNNADIQVNHFQNAAHEDITKLS